MSNPINSPNSTCKECFANGQKFFFMLYSNSAIPVSKLAQEKYTVKNKIFSV